MTVSKAASNAVAPAAKGDLVIGSGTNASTVLGVASTAGWVLTVDSATTTGLKWAAASAGGMTLIQETVANANSSIAFNSISGSYKQLMLVWEGVYHNANGNAFGLRFNNDSGSNYSFMYSRLVPSVTTIGLSRNNSATDIVDSGNGAGPFGYDVTSSNDFSKQCQGFILIDNYASTSKVKTWEGRWTNQDAPANNYMYTGTGVYKSTSAITSLDIVRITGSSTITNATSSSIRLYGVS